MILYEIDELSSEEKQNEIEEWKSEVSVEAIDDEDEKPKIMLNQSNKSK